MQNNPTFYLYESHLDGSIFWKDHELSVDERRCSRCEDYDWFIGVVKTPGDVWRLFADNINVNNSGGYEPEYIVKLIQEIPFPKIEILSEDDTDDEK